MNLKNDKFRKPYSLLLCTNLVTGFLTVGANTVLDPMIREYQWSDSRGALLITSMSIGNVLTAAFGNLIAAKIGRRRSLCLCAALTMISFGLVALLPSPALYSLLFFLAGCAWGGMNNLVNITISEMYDGNASRLNICHANYAIGAVIMPLIISLVLNVGGSWRIPIAIIAGSFLLLLIAAILIPLPDSAETLSGIRHGRPKGFGLMKEGGFWLFVICFFVYVGVETAVSAWLSSFLSRNNSFFKEVPAQTMVSLMWLMLLVGRFFFAAVGAKIDRRKLMLGLNAGFLIGLIGVVCFAHNTVAAILSTVILGLSMSATYATIISNAQRYVTGSPLVSGLLLSTGGLGSAAIPYVAGLVSDRWDLQTGMACLCGFLLIMVGAAVINLVRKQPE